MFFKKICPLKTRNTKRYKMRMGLIIGLILPMTFSLAQNQIDSLPEKVVYLRISEFCAYEIARFQEQISQLPDSIKGIILDLRDNPGGVIDIASYFATYWLEKNTIIFEKVDCYNRVQYVQKSDNPSPLFKNIKTVILVNKNTASSAELLTLTLKLNHNAIIIGQRTFGKDSIVYHDITGTEIIIGFWRVRGKSIHKIGIKPDIWSKKPLKQAIRYFNEI